MHDGAVTGTSADATDAAVAPDARLTAFMIVKDEAERLPGCLDSLAGCVDAIVVLDTGSTDATVDYLQRRAARGEGPPLTWDRVPFRGFGPTGQQALERVTTPWALWLAADETVSPPLARRLRALRRTGELNGRDAWHLRRHTRVLGRLMTQRNLANERVLRLFRREAGAISPSPVHEGLILAPGAVAGSLDEPLLHDTMPCWRAYLAKIDRYTTLDAQRGIRRASWRHLATGAPVAFLRNYVGRGGCLDGWPGFVWAATNAWSVWLLDWKLLKGRRTRR